MSLRERHGDIARIEMYASFIIIITISIIVVIIIIIIIIVIIINIYYYHYLEFYTVPHEAKRKKKKDFSTYDLQIVCLTMETQVCLIEPKYEQ